jgi:hypothetical protein
MQFPERVYTEKEVKQAKALIDKGYKHKIQIISNTKFKKKAEKGLRLIKVADFYDFFTTYIRTIKEIDGLTQLRQSEASIWTNEYAVENPVDAASLFIQKANSMKEYLERKLYYGGEAEKRSFEKRKEFLKILRNKSPEKHVVDECERLLNMWDESSIVY